MDTTVWFLESVVLFLFFSEKVPPAFLTLTHHMNVLNRVVHIDNQIHSQHGLYLIGATWAEASLLNRSKPYSAQQSKCNIHASVTPDLWAPCSGRPVPCFSEQWQPNIPPCRCPSATAPPGWAVLSLYAQLHECMLQTVQIKSIKTW